jgi:RNA polymerase sigma-70 factor (ECF subfamily)
METFTRADGFDRRILNSIKYHSIQLARAGAVPGMEKTDYEQDLLLDLIRRQKNFRPELSRFRTFADRLIRNRIRSMTTPTRRLRAERQWTSLDVQVADKEAAYRPLAEVLHAECESSDIALGLQMDVRRLVVRLPSELRDVCEVLLADSIIDGVREVGISRSTLYDRLARLREQAAAVGLDLYLKPDTFERAAVCDGRGQARELAHNEPGETLMPVSPALLPARLSTERDFCRWLDNAESGALLEYHRGNLAMHIGAQGQGSEIARLGRRARWAADRRLVHLVQFRHGRDDYSYLAVMRPKDCASENIIFVSEVAS